MNYLQVCAVVKDERYLPEWVEYHRIVGVEHFYLYDGSASPGASLKRQVDEGFVTVIPFPGRAQQFNAYNDYLRNFKTASRWVAFIDADEFLVPIGSDDLRSLLRKYEKYAGLAVSWVVFGSSYRILRPKGTQIESYTLRRLYSPSMRNEVKCIVQPVHTIAVGDNPHVFIYEDGYKCVNEKFDPVTDAFAQNSTESLQLNHYCTRSYCDFRDKMRRGMADTGRPRALLDFFQIDHYANATYDDKILRFLPELKRRLHRSGQERHQLEVPITIRKIVYSILFWPFKIMTLGSRKFAPIFAPDS